MFAVVNDISGGKKPIKIKGKKIKNMIFGNRHVTCFRTHLESVKLVVFKISKLIFLKWDTIVVRALFYVDVDNGRVIFVTLNPDLDKCVSKLCQLDVSQDVPICLFSDVS